jgi:hypothetical protein
MPANASALFSGHLHLQSSAGPSDAEVVGPVIFGGGSYTGIYAQHTAYAAAAFPMSYPSGASGNQELFAPLTLPPNQGCLSSGTVALSTSTPGNLYTYFVVFDYCGANAPQLVAGEQIDNTFRSNYLFTNQQGLPIYATLSFTTDAVPTASSTWYMLLYNFSSGSWNLVYQDTGLSGTTYGYSVFESTYQPGPCPGGLPVIAADYLQLYSAGTGTFETVAPTMSGTTSSVINPSSSTPCFLADSSGPATNTFTVVNPNSYWTVTTVPSVTVDMRNYMVQPLNGSMLCQADNQLCLTSYLNTTDGEFETIYTNTIHDYVAVTGSNSRIGVIRSYQNGQGLGLRCFSNPGAICSSPPNSQDVPEAVPLFFTTNVVSLQTELASENSDGSPMRPIQGAVSPSNGQYLQFGINYLDTSTCAQTYFAAQNAFVYGVYVTGVQFGGNVGTQDAMVIDEYETAGGSTPGIDSHVERYFYVRGLGRVREAAAWYDPNDGLYDAGSHFNSVRNMIASNTVTIPPAQCSQGSTTSLQSIGQKKL